MRSCGRSRRSSAVRFLGWRRGGGVPDLDAIGTSIRNSLPGCGTAFYAALLEARGAELPSPPCPDCGRRMERHSRSGKTFQARMGPVRIERSYCYCRECGAGFHQLDRTLGLEGRTAAPGAESLYADVASSESCGQACRKLKNLAGVEVPKTTLLRHVAGIGEEMQAFERADAEASPAAERVLLGIDGTGVPMAAREVEGVVGKQADGTAKTREAKAVVCRDADSLDPKTGEPRKGRNGVLAAEEVVVLSDGAPWIRTVCEEILPGRKTTFILDLYHALEYASAAVQAAAPDKGKQAAWMDWIRKQLDAGRAERVVAALKRYRRFEAVEACIRYCEANMDRMRYDLYRRRELPVGSGIVESVCKRIVGSRLKGAGRRWSKAGANAVLAIGRCLENRRWPDFLEWRACSAPAA